MIVEWGSMKKTSLVGKRDISRVYIDVENDTLNTRAKLTSECQPRSIGELVGLPKKVCVIHERSQPRNLWPFRHRSHGVVRERPRFANRPAGSQLPCSGKS